MSGLNKSISVALILMLILSVTGCSATPGSQSPINSPVKISYLIQNPIVANTTEKTDAPEFYESRISLTGLKDAGIEKGINDEISALFEEVKGGSLPPYRGIKRMIPENSELTGSTVSTNLSYNYNNVASIVVYGYRNYVTPDKTGKVPTVLEERYQYSQYVGITKSLNYDLNTGKQISLKDVFTDDVDYIEILNDYIGNLILRNNVEDEGYYGMAFSGAKLIAPFKGISADQSFFLVQGGLGLILDENNPEFDIGFYPATIIIGFNQLGDSIAITKRFYDEALSPFTSDAPKIKEFIQSYAGQETVKESSSKIGHIMIYSSYRYPDQIPQEVKERILALSVIDQDRIAGLNAAYVAGNDDGSFEQVVWATKAGPYTSVQRNTNYYANGGWESATDSICFDQEGRELALKELFIAGFDYETSIRKALTDSMTQMSLRESYSVDTLMQTIQFSIGNSEINIYTDTVKADATSSYPIYAQVTFREFGCENLTLFQE